MIASASPEPADHITILSCSRPLVLTKTWQADGTVKAYGKAKHFSVRAQPLANIEDLSRVLAALEGDPQSCVIRGSLPDGAHTKDVLRHKEQFAQLSNELAGPKGFQQIIAALVSLAFLDIPAETSAYWVVKQPDREAFRPDCTFLPRWPK